MESFSTYWRNEYNGNPAGWTVCKGPTLPEGEFQADEYLWGLDSLWFVTADKFTEDER